MSTPFMPSPRAISKRAAFGASIDARFSLIDHFGRAVTEQDFRGRHLLVFFGFTHCRVVCPRTLGRITDALRALRDVTRPVQALYITVDPERDSPEVMRDFLETSYPLFLGLTGSREAIERTKSGFKVFAKPAFDEQDPDGYVVPHTAFTYVIDTNGQYLMHFPASTEAEEMARKLLPALVPHAPAMQEERVRAG